MKKLILSLCAAALLMTAAVLNVSAAEEEFETETITSLDGYYFIDNKDIEIENAKEMVIDTVDGVERPVIRVALTGIRSDFGIKFDDIPDGDYLLTAKYYCPADPGEGRFGLRRENSINYPDNSPKGAITQNDTYTTVTKNVTVNDNGNNDFQYARIRFTGGAGGENDYCYIAEFKLQPVNEDGTTGDNILPEFYTERIKGTTEGWNLENSSDTAIIDYANVNGVYKPVVKWSYQDKNSHFRYWLEGALAKGDYRISVTYYAPKNPGTGRVGIRNDVNGGFPGNNTETTIVKNTGYETVTRDVTVVNDVAQQYLDIACEYGDAADLYISEVKLQPINEDGSLGENLIPNSDFMLRKLPEPDQFEANNLMFDIVDDAGESMTGNEGIDFIPNTDVYRLSASVNVKNNGDEVITPVLIIAMYYDGALYDTDMVPVTINEGENEDITVYMSIPDTVGEGKLNAKAFLWEGIGNMKPVTTFMQIEETVE